MKYFIIYILLFVSLVSCNKNTDNNINLPVENNSDSVTLPKNDSLALKYLNLAQLSTDSALFYLDKSKNIAQENNVTDSLYYLALYNNYSLYYEEKGDFEQAAIYKHLEQQNQYGSFQDRIKKAVEDVEKKYNREVVVNENNSLKIQSQYLWISLLIVGILILIICFIIYSRKQKHENELLEARQKIYDLKQMSETYNEKVNSARNILLEHLDVLKKSLLLENFLREEEKIKGHKLLQKFNEIVYEDSSFNWDLLYKIINEVNDGFFDKIKDKYPDLDDVEFKICCLIYIGFSNSEISIVLGKSINTVIAKRTSIRKKLDMKEHGNIIKFLDDNIPDNN